MALISSSNLEKSFGSRAVLRGLSLAVERGDRLGLIGRNGCGKTTLLNILAGREEADRGELHLARGLKLAWLDQIPKLDPERTVWQEARTALADLEDLERRLAEWHERIAAAPDHELKPAEREAFALDEAAFSARAGEDRERRLGLALEKLGLSAEMHARRCGVLSGGEQTRLGLAKFLVAPFNLLVLDEPTNHLDVGAIEWLQEALLETIQTCLVVSHDRAFLDAVCTKVAELEDGKLTVISGNYSQFMTVKAERLKALRREAGLEARFLAKEMDFIRRHMAGQRSREAKGRLKRLERREKIEVRSEGRAPALKFKGGQRHADVVLSVTGLSKELGGRTLFADLSLDLSRGEKIGIVGPNGAGKTTLARVLLGELPPTAGKLRLAPQLRVGTFTQNDARADASFAGNERTVLEEYTRLVNPPNLNVARGPLGAFLFSGNRVEQRVDSLSGGERARLALCILVAKENDVLVLDEPTNYLDIPSRQALEEALGAYRGTCLIISHDRFFLDRVTARTLWIAEGRARLYGCSYSEARDLREAELRPLLQFEAARKEREREQKAQAAAPRAKKINEFKLRAIETEMEDLERQRAELNASLYEEAVFRDAARMREVNAELARIEARLLELGAAWEAVIDAAG